MPFAKRNGNLRPDSTLDISNIRNKSYFQVRSTQGKDRVNGVSLAPSVPPDPHYVSSASFHFFLAFQRFLPNIGFSHYEQ